MKKLSSASFKLTELSLRLLHLLLLFSVTLSVATCLVGTLHFGTFEFKSQSVFEISTSEGLKLLALTLLVVLPLDLLALFNTRLADSTISSLIVAPHSKRLHPFPDLLNNLKKYSLRLLPRATAMLALVWLGTSWILNYDGLMGDHLGRGEILIFAALVWILQRRGLSIRPRYVYLFALLMGSLGLLLSTGNERIISDDHSTNFFRLQLLGWQFPRIPFFHPLWNGGIEARDFFASGILNVYLILWPLVELFTLKRSYNVIVLSVILFIPALSCFGTARYLKLSRNASFLAGLIALTSSLTWYRWALAYGTLGFLTSASLVPPLLALVSKIVLSRRALTFRESSTLVILATLHILWGIAGLIWIPFIFLSLIQAPRLIKIRTNRWILITLLALNLPWMSIFWQASKVTQFINRKEVHSHDANGEFHKVGLKPENKAPLSSKSVAKDLQQEIRKLNPLFVLFGFSSIYLLPTGFRLGSLTLSLWLIFLGIFGPHLKPQLELGRMFMLIPLVLAAPAALGVNRFFKLSFLSKNWTIQLLGSFFWATLLLGTWRIAGVLNNRSLAGFQTSDHSWRKMVKLIADHNQNGRVLFSGYTLHNFKNAHLAPLALESNTPLISPTYIHNSWLIVESIPDTYRKQGRDGVDRFLDLYNVGAVFTHRIKWNRFFDRHPNYKLVGEVDQFKMYQRKSFQTSYFLKGSGRIIRQNHHEVELTLSTNEAVIKFNYYDFLTVEGCKVTPYQADRTTRFIRLTDCPTDTALVIEAKNPASRFWLKPLQRFF